MAQPDYPVRQAHSMSHAELRQQIPPSKQYDRTPVHKHAVVSSESFKPDHAILASEVLHKEEWFPGRNTHETIVLSVRSLTSQV